MKTHRILAIAAVLLAFSAVVSFAAPVSQVQASGTTSVATQAAVPSLDAFLSSLSSATGPVNQAAMSCGPNFCSQAERDACTQQCLSHHHGPSVGLECCSDSCTTLCICGSVPTGC
jgi:hypothetical protein